MMNESSDFSALASTAISDLLIGGDYIPYLSGSDLSGIGTTFGITINSQFVSRSNMMQQILNKCHFNNKTNQLLNYLIRSSKLDIQVEALKKENTLIKNIEIFDENDNVVSNDNIQEQIINQLVRAINEELMYSDLKLTHIGRNFDVIPIDAVPQVVVSKERISSTFLKNILVQAEDDLRDGDYDSVVTKARTIIEGTFMQILDDRGIEYKEDGNIGGYRGKVVDALNMRIKSTDNVRVRKLVSGINKIVDTINEMRNDDSDAHTSSDRIAINAAEAQLLINSSVTIATYYLMVENESEL